MQSNAIANLMQAQETKALVILNNLNGERWHPQLFLGVCPSAFKSIKAGGSNLGQCPTPQAANHFNHSQLFGGAEKKKTTEIGNHSPLCESQRDSEWRCGLRNPRKEDQNETAMP